MHMLLMIVGLLLMLFGGGCTLLFFRFGPDSELMGVWLALGLAPQVGGFFLIRYGRKLGREKRAQSPNGNEP
jgi:hypothetical protein